MTEKPLLWLEERGRIVERTDEEVELARAMDDDSVKCMDRIDLRVYPLKALLIA